MRCADAPSPGSWQNSFVAFEGSCQGSQSGDQSCVAGFVPGRNRGMDKVFRIVKGERGAVCGALGGPGRADCYEPYS